MAMEDQVLSEAVASLQTSAQFHSLFSESIMELMHVIKYIQKLCSQVNRQYKSSEEKLLQSPKK